MPKIWPGIHYRITNVHGVLCMQLAEWTALDHHAVCSTAGRVDSIGSPCSAGRVDRHAVCSTAGRVDSIGSPCSAGRVDRHAVCSAAGRVNSIGSPCSVLCSWQSGQHWIAMQCWQSTWTTMQCALQLAEWTALDRHAVLAEYVDHHAVCSAAGRVDSIGSPCSAGRHAVCSAAGSIGSPCMCSIYYLSCGNYTHARGMGGRELEASTA